MVKKNQLVVIGGGLAGLCFAIDAKTKGLDVLLIEQKAYPFHKVCGEYISNEVKPYLTSLGIASTLEEAVDINQLKLSNLYGNSLQVDLPLGGFGISRYTLDNALYERAVQVGVEFIHDKVTAIEISSNNKIIHTKNHQIEAQLILAAHGKRALIDKLLNRKFIAHKTPWVGIKAHFEVPDFDTSIVELHNFHGGYCGISQVENKRINLCALVHTDVFKKYSSITDFVANEMTKNRFVSDFLREANSVFEDYLAISQISFQQKTKYEEGILFIGDTAGLIHPLCGNGMAMAIHSAKIASTHVINYMIHNNFDLLAANYKEEWRKTFQHRMKVGAVLQALLLKPKLTNIAMRMLTQTPTLVKTIIRQTHGEKVLPID